MIRRVLRVLEHPVAVGLALVGLGAAAVIRLYYPVTNGDIAWHLSLGRWIHRAGAVPLSEPFTYTAFGSPMVAHEWLTQWLYWQWVSLFGLEALRDLHAGLGVATIGLAFAYFRRVGAAPTLALLGTAWFIVLADTRFAVRPQMWNPVFGIALVGLVLESRGPLRPLAVCATALAVALWANLHSAAVIFPVLLWGVALVDFVQQRVAARPRWAGDFAAGDPARTAALAAACSAAVLATPNHFRLLPYLVESGRINSGRSIEWLPLTHYFDAPDHAWLIAAWVATLVGTLLAGAFVWREGRRWAPGALALVCALAPLQSVRFVWLAFVPIGFTLAEASRFLSRRSLSRRDAVHAVVGGVIVVLALAAWLRAPARVTAPFFGSWAFPLQSLRLLEEVPVAGRVFARPEWGGLITWVFDERVPTFADGRWVTIGERVVKDAHIMATGRPRALPLLDHWEIDVVVSERGWLANDAQRPSRNRAWVRMFAGYNSEVWVRRGAPGEANRRAFLRYYAAHGIPVDLRRGFQPRTAIRANPDWAREHGVTERFVQHFLPGGDRSETGYEARLPDPPDRSVPPRAPGAPPGSSPPGP